MATEPPALPHAATGGSTAATGGSPAATGDPFAAIGPGTSTLKNEFDVARRVLMSVMPPAFEREDCAFDVRYRPMIGIGGDHASLEPIGRTKCFFTISDVTGHGIAAALMVRDVNGYVKGLISREPRPAKIVDRLNDYLIQVFSNAGIFMTFACGLVDLSTGEMWFCGAGHPPLIVAGPARERPQVIYSQNPLLGFERARRAKSVEERIEIFPGDRIVFYTDGLIETRDPAEGEFGIGRLVDLCGTEQRAPLASYLESIIAAIDRFRGGGRQRDDLLVASLEFRTRTQRMARPK